MPNNVLNQLRSLRDGVAEELRRDPRYQTLQALDKSIAEITNVLAGAGLLPPGKPASSLSARLSGLGPSMDALAEPSAPAQQQISAASPHPAGPHSSAEMPEPDLERVLPAATETIKPGFKGGTVGQPQPAVPDQTGAPSLLRPAAGLVAAEVAGVGVTEMALEHAAPHTEEAAPALPHAHEAPEALGREAAPNETAPDAVERGADEPAGEAGEEVHEAPPEPEDAAFAMDGENREDHEAPLGAAADDEHIGEHHEALHAEPGEGAAIDHAAVVDAAAGGFLAENPMGDELLVEDPSNADPSAEDRLNEDPLNEDPLNEDPLAADLAAAYLAARDPSAESAAADLPQARATGYLPMAARPDAPQYAPSIAVKFGKLPNRVDLRPLMRPVEDQGAMQSCVADAVTSAYEYWLKKSARKEGALSRLFVYYNARWRDDRQEEDGGSAIQLAMEGLQKFGACAETVWPSDAGQVLTRPGLEAYKDAAPTRTHDMARVPLKLDAWKQALAEGKPVIFGVALFASFEACAAQGGVVTMPAPGELAHLTPFFHCLCAVGYSESEKVFIVRNAWGPSFGDAGYCYMPYDYLLNPRLNDGDCWVFVPKVPSQPPRETWHDEAAPVANGGRGVGFAIQPHRLEEYRDLALDLFARNRQPWKPSAAVDYGAYASAVSRAAFGELGNLAAAPEPAPGAAEAPHESAFHAPFEHAGHEAGEPGHADGAQGHADQGEAEATRTEHAGG